MTTTEGTATGSLFWWITRAKREKAAAFLEAPSAGALEDWVSPYHCYATRGIADVEVFVHETVLAGTTPEALAAALVRARDEDDLAEVLAVDGVSWPLATELARAVSPASHAVVTRRACRVLRGLGYGVPPPDAFDADRYREFRDAMAAVVETDGVCEAVDAAEGPIPPWASASEVADCAVGLEAAGAIDLAALGAGP